MCVLCTGPVFEGFYTDFSHKNTVRNEYSPSSTKEGILNVEQTVIELFKSEMLSIKENGKFSHLFVWTGTLFESWSDPSHHKRPLKSRQKQQYF